MQKSNLIRRPPSSLNISSSSSSSSASLSRPGTITMHSRSSSANSVASSSGNDGAPGIISSGNSSGYAPLPISSKGNTSTSSPYIQSLLQTQLAKVTTGFTSLSNSPPELWKAYLLKFLDSYAYFSFSLVFTLFLSDEFGMSDIQAGTIYGAWGALITIFGLFTGTIIDNLGVAKCLRIGFVLSFLSRIVIFTTTSKAVLLSCLLVSLPFGNCLGIPVLTIGLRRYTNDANRGFAFGLFYCVMNVGALVAGPLVDALTIYYNDKDGIVDGSSSDATSTTTASSSSWVMTNNRAIILTGVVANLIAVCVAFSVREIKVDNAIRKKESPALGISQSLSSVSSHDDDNFGEEPDSHHSKASSSNVTQFQPTKGSPYQILSETLREPNFRRFLVVCLLTLNVRMIFRHMDGTLPKYMIREFGPDTPKGRVYAINPALIIILVPIITAATSAVNPLLMIHHGAYVSALSVFFLAFSTSLPACVLFVTTLSIGEAIWSPRLYDYTTTIAPEGREGTYMALSSAPLFLAKLPVGFLSGLLLQRYCPEKLEEGEVRHSKTMWMIIGLSTIVSPILISLLWGYLNGTEKKTRGNDDSMMNNGNETMYENEEQMAHDSSEHSYQHKPLTHQISLPRVRQSDRPIV